MEELLFCTVQPPLLSALNSYQLIAWMNIPDLQMTPV
jgi:hypothetical protein